MPYLELIRPFKGFLSLFYPIKIISFLRKEIKLVSTKISLSSGFAPHRLATVDVLSTSTNLLNSQNIFINLISLSQERGHGCRQSAWDCIAPVVPQNG